MQQSNSIPFASRPAVNRMLMLVILSAANVLVSFMIQSLNVALPSIGQEFAATTTQLNWMVLVYVLAVAASSVPFGRVADILGLKRIIITGMVIYTLSSLICLFAGSATMLIAGRAVQGIGAAMVVANIPALITTIFPAEERGRALGMNITGVYLGSTTGPFLGGLLTGAFGWRSIFLVNLPIGVLILIFILWKIRGEWSASQGQKFDYPGSAVFAVALVVLIFGLSLLPSVMGAAPIAIGHHRAAGFPLVGKPGRQPAD
jgi:MFS family permease